jgi:toxin CcdB
MQFDVYANKDRDTNKEFPYLLDIQSDTLKKLATRIVVPLTPSSMIKFPVKTLHLGITIKGKKYIALFDELASYSAEELTKPVQNIGDYRAEIFEAMDLIIQGY